MNSRGRYRPPVRTPAVVQAQASECGVASLGIILAYFGRPVPMAELRKVTGVSRDGIGGPDLIRAGRHYGLEAHAYKLEPEAIAGRTGFPAIVFLGFMHFAVVEGVDDERIYLNDPACGRCEVPIEEFREDYTGVVFHYRPGPGFIPCPATGSAARYALGLLSREPGLLAGVAATSTVAVVAGIAVALVPALGLPAGAVGLVWVAAIGALGLRQHLLDVLLHRLATENTTAAVRRVFDLPFSFHIYRIGGSIQGHALAHESIAAMLSGSVLPTLAAGAALPFVLSAMAWLHGPTAVAVAALLGVHAVALHARHQRRVADFFRRRVLQSTADNSLQQVATVEMFRSGGMEGEAMGGTAAREARYLRYEQRYGEFVSVANAAASLLQALLFMLVLGFAGTALRAGTLSPAALVSLLLLAALCLPAMRRFPGLLRDLADLSLTCPPVAEIEEEPRESLPSPLAGEGGERSEPGEGAQLALRGVSFGYAALKPPLLRDLSLTLAPGVQIGVTGPSGCGKSTLAGLLVGLHQPWAGSVEYGGRALSDYDRETLSRHVAWVGRAPLLFEGSLRDNLRLGDERISDADLAAAVRDAGLDQVLAQRSGGLDGPVSARGLNFSGGQRQRLELARSLARNPRVVILDEALEALEPRLERQIRDQLRRRGCAVLVISHRATSLAACDRVLLLQNGALVDQVAPAAQPIVAEPPQLESPAARISQSNRDDLLEAFMSVAEASGLRDVRAALAEIPTDADVDVPLLARRCGASAYPMRFVLDRWWQQDHGPLLAFRRSSDEPCAVLPSLGGNVIVESGRRRRLAGDEAGQFQPVAFALLPLLADGVSSSVPLLRVATGGLAGEGLRLLAAAPLAAALAVVPALAATAWLAPMSHAAAPLVLAWVVLAAAAGFLLDWVSGNALLRAEGALMLRVAVALWGRLLRLPQAWLRGLPVSEIARRLRIAHRLRSAFGWERMLDLCAALPAFAALGVLVATNAPVALPVATGVLVLAVLPPLLAHWLRALRRECDRQAAQNRALLLGALHGIAQLRCCAAERRLVSRWERSYRDEKRIEHRLRLGTSVEMLGPELALLIAAGIAAAAAGVEATILALIALPAAAACGRGLAALVRAAHLAQPLAEFLGHPLEPAAAAPADARLNGHIAVRNVSFRFADLAAPVLEDVSLTVQPGQIVALVGPSGGGKSTLLRLLLGFEQPAAGKILYDGIALAQRGHAAVRAQIGAVLQEEQLYPATVRYNIAHHAASDLAQVWAVAEAAGIAQEIRAMPMDMQTLVDEVKMSTGQKQRIFIAAKLLRRPRILLLDEATSVLHEELQARLFANLRALRITCLCATHRASAVAHADWVHVIENGRIVQSGAPRELLERDGPLRRMQTEQASGVYTLADAVDLF